MKLAQIFLSVAILSGVFAYAPISALAQTLQVKGVKPGVIAAMPLNKSGTFCHLRYPAIRGKTLGTGQERLKPATTDDIVDYYGACDHNPLGKEEIQAQIEQQEARMRDND